MTMTLVERDLASFFRVPFEVYGESSPYVSPLKDDIARMLDDKKNPFFKSGEATYYTAVVDGQPRGRIVCHVHHACNVRWGEKAASFGFFDCANDEVIARALLAKAEAHARGWGCTLLRGNMNLTAAQECGVVVGGFEHAPCVAQVWNPPHIPTLLEASGFRGVYPMTTFIGRQAVLQRDWDATLQDKSKAILADPAYKIRTANMKDYQNEVQRIREVLNDAMHDNRLFVDITPAEMEFQLGPYQSVMDPNLVWIAEHNGVPVGATLCAPDLNPLLREMKSRVTPLSALTFLRKRRKMKGASVVIIIVKKAYQAKGVIGVLNAELMKALVRGKYEYIAGTWIADVNRPSLRQAELFGMDKLHRADIFEKAL